MEKPECIEVYSMKFELNDYNRNISDKELRQHRTNAKIHIVGKPFSKKQ